MIDSLIPQNQKNQPPAPPIALTTTQSFVQKNQENLEIASTKLMLEHMQQEMTILKSKIETNGPSNTQSQNVLLRQGFLP